VGDILEIQQNERVPADLLILATEYLLSIMLGNLMEVYS